MTAGSVHAGAIALAMSILTSIAMAADDIVPSVHLDLNVRLNPDNRELNADAEFAFAGGGAITMTLGKRFMIDELTLDGHPAVLERQPVGEHQQWHIELPKPAAPHRIRLRYRGELAPLVQADERSVLGGLPPMASERGSFLPAGSGWYPELASDTFTYRLQLELPAGQRGLSAGRLLHESVSDTRYLAQFEFAHPAEGIDLVAGPYRVEQRELSTAPSASVELRTYFHPEIADLAAGYLDAAAGYITRYSNAIGAYPYAAFSIVSSVLPTGFGMPSFTYLGIDVLRLPFIRTTSLGHEVLHNWWGNGVYVDWQSGNWSEGLTTFMADYAYKQDESEAAAQEMRASWLRDFAALPAERDQPLRSFTSRTHDASQIVGYDKAAFLFLMLRDELSREAFDAGIRRFWNQQQFRRAAWTDLQHAFEQASGRDLREFFSQWLDRSGAPSLAVERASQQQAGSRYRVQLTLTQGEPSYRLRVPITVQTDQGSEDNVLQFDSARKDFSFETKGRPLTMTVDPALRVFRRLNAREISPILRQVTLDPSTVTVLATKGTEFQEAARALTQRLMDTGPRSAADALPRGASIILLGLSEDVDAWLAHAQLPPEPQHLRNRGTAQVWTTQLAEGKTLLAVSARDVAALQALLRPLPHYGRQSWLVFDGAKAIDRGIWPTHAVSWRFE